MSLTDFAIQTGAEVVAAAGNKFYNELEKSYKASAREGKLSNPQEDNQSLYTTIGGAVSSLVNNALGTGKAEEEAEWMNNGWFASLAQKRANAYMSANKERIPMIIEYPTAPGKRESVTMYINPSKLQFKNNKIKGKQVTRGSIFYHHWGDDDMQITLSGNTGLSAMAGIKKLDQIYRMSGVLLAYGESTQGPVYTDGDTNMLNQLSEGNFMGAVGAVLSGQKSITNIAKGIGRHITEGAVEAVTGRQNRGLQSSKVAAKARDATAGAVQRYVENAGQVGGSIVSDMVSSAAAAGITAISNSINGIDGPTGCLEYLNENRVTFDDASGGFNDIIDELEDPWRPRQVYIYFEDHVYIGHFDNFNYVRDASSVNITYDMTFTVIREVIITSYSPTLPSFTPAGGV